MGPKAFFSIIFVLLFFAGVLVISILANMENSHNGGIDVTTTSTTTATTNSASVTKTTPGKTTTTTGSTTQFFQTTTIDYVYSAIGESVYYEFGNGAEIRFTVHSFYTGDSYQYELGSSQYTMEAEEGIQYLWVEVSCENTGIVPAYFPIIFDLYLIVDSVEEEYATWPIFVVIGMDMYNPDSELIDPGVIEDGFVRYEVGARATDFYIAVELNFWPQFTAYWHLE
jgi:hypothetical protein